MSSKSNKGTVSLKAPLNILLAALLIIIVIGAAWFIFIKLQPRSTAAKPSASKLPVATVKLHSADEALKSVTEFYTSYLPLKAQTVAKVGDDPNLEPAAVQVARASKESLDSKFYTAVLSDYMSEYQSTGKVTKDEIVCVNNAKSLGAVALASQSSGAAIVNVTLSLSDGTKKLVPVTIDLQNLTITKVSCSQL